MKVVSADTDTVIAHGGIKASVTAFFTDGYSVAVVMIRKQVIERDF